MEAQTLKDSSDHAFVVTDLLRGMRCFVADKRLHYEIEVPREGGCAKVLVSRKADMSDETAIGRNREMRHKLSLS